MLFFWHVPPWRSHLYVTLWGLLKLESPYRSEAKRGGRYESWGESVEPCKVNYFKGDHYSFFRQSRANQLILVRGATSTDNKKLAEFNFLMSPASLWYTLMVPLPFAGPITSQLMPSFYRRNPAAWLGIQLTL